MGIFSGLFGDGNDRKIDAYKKNVDKINELEQTFESFSPDQLKEKTVELRKRLENGETLDDILPEAFANVREAAKRTLNQRHYDVQLMGGMALHNGNIAEMKTGEGKTLVATLPAYLNALTGKGVHVVTVNDYLSKRDAVWMGQIYNALGLSTACINHDSSFLYDEEDLKASQRDEDDKERDEKGSFEVVQEFLKPVRRKEAYLADITYGTNNEFGFDYLRDNMAATREGVVQAKGHNFSVVDEIDSILIDESRTPLIISAPDSESTNLYGTFSKIVPGLKENEDYNVDEKLKAVSITEDGISKVEKSLNLDNIYEEGGTRYVHHLEQALKAHILFKKDKEYVVRDGQIVIVDEFTGRMMPGRRWSGGLHQAVEAKEGVYVQKESRTFATITFQNYFRLYDKLSGMTGTAKTSQEEFHKVYNMDVVAIPTNKPLLRLNSPDRIYKTEEGKLRAIVQEVKGRNKKGQPVLIGTVSIQKNEQISSYLKREGVPHEVLNAKKHDQEGSIIAQAGKFGAVTVATNMAGRGVDVLLGGNPPEANAAQKVIDLGGLHVIGTERHEARRIDDQLRGRAGRQGDPGSSQFFVSTEDEVIRVFSGDRLRKIMETLGVGEDDAIENKLVSRAIEQAQTKIEGHHFDSRKHVLDYDDVMSKHRTTIYELRAEVRDTDDVKDKVVEYIHQEIDAMVAAHIDDNTGHSDVGEVVETMKAMIPINATQSAGLRKRIEDALDKDGDEGVRTLLTGLADDGYFHKETSVGETEMRRLEKAVLLRAIDELWVDHLEQMEYLRDSVRLRAYGQRDPLIEYRVEGQKMFTQLLGTLANQVAGTIYKVGFMKSDSGNPKGLHAHHQHAGMSDSDNEKQSQVKSVPTVRGSDGKKIGRNDPCPCGSGKKYKKCGLINAPEHKT